MKGISDAAARAIVFGKDFKASIKSIGQAIATQLLSQLIQIGVQAVINATLGQTLAAAATASTVAQLGVIAAAAAPAAALASLASFGTNAAPANAAIAATLASTQALAAAASAVPGFADGGLISGRGTGRSDSNIIRVSDGEFIVNSLATSRFRPVLEMINSGALGSGPAVPTGGDTRTINFGGISIVIEGGNTSPEETADLVDERIREVLLDETRTGGILEDL